MRRKFPASFPGALTALLLGGITLARAQSGPADPAGATPSAENVSAATQADMVESAEARRRANVRVEEIVVRARKRDELLEDTPVSVTALSESTLREAGVVRLDQIQELVPNLQFQTSNNGQGAQVFIRGVGTSTAEIAFDAGVGIYVDGVFLPRAAGSIIDTVDVGQIEVLRGPQGTLFGKNTVGGAIDIRTVKPHEDLEAFAMLRPGNLGTLDSRIMLNLPVRIGWLADKLFSRIAFAQRTFGGYVENVRNGQMLSNRNSLSFLGSLRFLPVDGLTLDVSGSWSKDQNAGLGPRCEVTNPRAPLIGVYPGYVEDCEASQPFRFDGNTAQLSVVESYGVWGTATWALGDALGLENLEARSITSWREQAVRIRLDLDATRFPAVQISSAGGPSPLDGPPGHQRQISQEVQLNGAALDGDLNFVVGFFALWETGLDSRTVASGLGVLDFVSNQQTNIDNWTWAPYAQATYDLFDWMSLTAGLRYTEDKKGAFVFTTNPTAPADPPSLDTGADKVFSSWTPMGSIALRAPADWLEPLSLDHLLAYFTYARGFKGGGFNAVFNPIADSLDPFAPETLDSFELGFKSIAWDQRITFNTSFFLGQYDDIQVTSVRDLTRPGDEIPTIIQLTQNAAEATTRGAEFELLALPVSGLRLTGSVGLLHTRYDSFPNAIDDRNGQTIDRAGQTFRRAPELQTHVSAQYSFAISWPGPDWLQGWLTPRLDWYYQSFMHFEGIEVDATNQPGYNLLHGRLSYDFFDDRAQVALWAKNLTDMRYKTFGLTSVAASWGVSTPYYAAPRTFGGELSYRF